MYYAPPIPHPPRRRRWRLIKWTFLLAVWGAIALGLALLWFTADLPRPEAALDAARRPSLTLQDRAGHPYASFGDVVGDPLRLSDLPPYLPAAAVAVEDRRFYSHHGLDVTGIARAVWVNLSPAGWCRAAPPSPSRWRRTCSSPMPARCAARCRRCC